MKTLLMPLAFSLALAACGNAGAYGPGSGEGDASNQQQDARSNQSDGDGSHQGGATQADDPNLDGTPSEGGNPNQRIEDNPGNDDPQYSDPGPEQ